jgi:ribose 5-phosphate isomerase B
VKVYIASDHAGFELKKTLVAYVHTLGHDVEDCGPKILNPLDDYPDYIIPMAKKVCQNEGSFGIALGGSGEGEAIAANRIPNIRAAAYYGGPMDIVRLAREHNNANILSLGARFVTPAQAKDAVSLFLSTPFSGDERHIRRNDKLDD